jgi:hypothetical protein
MKRSLTRQWGGDLVLVLISALALMAACTFVPQAHAQSRAMQAWDGTTYRDVLVDGTGTLYSKGNTVTGVTAATVNGMMTGGSDGTNYRHFATNTAGYLQVLANGAAGNGTSLASVLGVMTGGSDGTNYRHFKVNNNGLLLISNGYTGGSVLGTTGEMLSVGGTDGTNARILRTDSSGYLLLNNQNVASGGTDSGNPVKVGGVYNSTLPTFTTGQRGDLQITSRGAVQVQITDGSTNTYNIGSGSDAAANAVGGLNVYNRPSYYNGLTWDRACSASTSCGTNNGTGTAQVAIMPLNSSAAGNAPSANSAVGSSLVVKASAGNLYGWRVVAGASAGFVLMFDAISAPADGAVTPKDCVPVAANGTVGERLDIGDRYTTGITIVFSTTGCFTKTASATAFIRATFQ